MEEEVQRKVKMLLLLLGRAEPLLTDLPRWSPPPFLWGHLPRHRLLLRLLQDRLRSQRRGLLVLCLLKLQQLQILHRHRRRHPTWVERSGPFGSRYCNTRACQIRFYIGPNRQASPQRGLPRHHQSPNLPRFLRIASRIFPPERLQKDLFLHHRCCIRMNQSQLQKVCKKK